jgi:hypothetical protein
MSEAQETLLLVFTGVVALAILIQSLALLGIFISVRKISRRFEKLSEDLLTHVHSISNKADDVLAAAKAVTEASKVIRENLTATSSIIHQKATDLSTTVQKRVTNLDEFLNETTEIARAEIAKFQGVVENTSRRLDDTFNLLHHGIVAPLSELNAIATGLRTAFDVFFRKRDPSARIHQDEEMFI